MSNIYAIKLGAPGFPVPGIQGRESFKSYQYIGVVTHASRIAS